MKKHCSCLWPLVIFFSWIAKVLNTKRQVGNGGGGTSSWGREKRDIYRTCFCYAWNATPRSHVVTHIAWSRWWEGLGFCLGLPAQPSFAFLSPVVRGKASRRCTTAQTTALTFPSTTFCRGTKCRESPTGESKKLDQVQAPNGALRESSLVL